MNANQVAAGRVPETVTGTRTPGAGRPVKLVAIGIGSVIFGVQLLRDVFRVPEFRGAELWLVDVNDDALGRMTRLAGRLNAAADWDVLVRSTPDRREALPEADFVVTSVAIDRIATWQADHTLALRHGFASVLSENGGPGGLSHTLRSVPLVLDIGRDVERLAPRALLFNYTNPENRVCLALRRHTSVRAIGLCHSVAEAIEDCARVLGRQPDQIEAKAAGVNHFTWFLSIRDARDGSDLLPEFRRRIAAGDAGTAPLRRMLFERLGTCPAIDDDHVGEYLPWAADVIGTTGYDFEAFERRSRTAVARLDAWGSGKRPVEPLLAEPSREASLNHSAAEIMADVIAGRTRGRPSFILANDGLIDDMPLEAVVEAPGLVQDGVPRGVPIGSLPDPVAALVRHELSIQEVAVEAAVEGSRDLALRALLLDPVVNAARAAEQFLDDVLRSHRDVLPRFWS
ncbi:MAG TPA: alpha-glucosidase/alpha-galactosidase [Candidatus Limnocylindria bacterium]|nr:alpha-glucosidase/alpha-galactosidase [Candidatus Limnocylindria bacterium]